MTRRANQRGFVLLDAIGAVLIVTALGLSMLYAMRGYRRAMSSLNDAQQAITLAETTLVKLQAGEAPPRWDDQTDIAIEPLNEGHLLPGRRWVMIRVTYKQHEARLVGVVPLASGSGGGR